MAIDLMFKVLQVKTSTRDVLTETVTYHSYDFFLMTNLESRHDLMNVKTGVFPQDENFK